MTTANPPGAYDPGPLLTPREVADMFRVDVRTASRWGVTGKLSCIRTPGGHLRFREAEVRALVENSGGQS